MRAASFSLLVGSALGHDFCSHIARDPPKHCACSNDPGGFTFSCSADILGKDTLDVSLAVQPCGEPASASLAIADTKFHLHHELAGLVANDKALRVPFPGLSLNLGHFGNAGVIIDFDLTTPGSTTDKHLDIDLGFDLCATIKILHKHKSICGSKLDHHLPLKVLSKSYDFTAVCTNTTLGTGSVAAIAPEKCIASGQECMICTDCSPCCGGTCNLNGICTTSGRNATLALQSWSRKENGTSASAKN